MGPAPCKVKTWAYHYHPAFSAPLCVVYTHVAAAPRHTRRNCKHGWRGRRSHPAEVATASPALATAPAARRLARAAAARRRRAPHGRQTPSRPIHVCTRRRGAAGTSTRTKARHGKGGRARRRPQLELGLVEQQAPWVLSLFERAEAGSRDPPVCRRPGRRFEGEARRDWRSSDRRDLTSIRLDATDSTARPNVGPKCLL
jgi:hypothetical protein